MKWKKRLIEAGILASVFIFAILFFSYTTNKENNNMTADMGTASRPQVSFSCAGYTINTLPAYKYEMDIPAVRDMVTPIVNQQLSLNLNAYDNFIRSLTYAVYSLDGKEQLFEYKLKEPEENVLLTFNEEGLLTEERVLKITLELDDEQIVYMYTRIKDAAFTNAEKCLDYIRDFHENALKKAEDTGIGRAIEPNEKGDNTTLYHVTINSDYDHVTWGSLSPQVEGTERWSIKEINSTYTSVLIEYRVRCKGEENEEDLYNVREFFRVRHTADNGASYLLDYDRTMDQVFNASKHILNGKGIILGITDPAVSYMTNKKETTVSFIQAKELWNYNKDSDEISLVFSFADAENTDSRNLYSEHDIKLLDMDDDGNTIFAVYGYMNRGEHEGEVGVAVYYYNIRQNSVEEKVFISSRQSYKRTEYELGRLMYYSADRDMMYTLTDNTLYEINVKRRQMSKIASGLSEHQYVVSEDGHIAAYQVKISDKEQIIVKNFNTGDEHTIESGDTETLQPLGFIKNDFVYGTARKEDIGTTASGQPAIPMYKIEIEDENGKTVKTYEQNGLYILNAEFETNMITLNRATKSGTTYTAAAEDYITNNEEEKQNNIFVEAYITDLKESQVRITYSDGISDKEPKLLKPKQVLFENPAVISFDSETNDDHKCYMYALGELKGIYNNAGIAIQEADECNGVVVSAHQAYIWERGNRDLRYNIAGKDGEIEGIRVQLNDGKSPSEVMDSFSNGRSIDLTGCTAEQLLYIINQNIPIIAMLDTQDTVILTGYSNSTINYIVTSSGERLSVPYSQMDSMTQGSGNTYVGYSK